MFWDLYLFYFLCLGRALCHECNDKVKATAEGKYMCQKCRYKYVIPSVIPSVMYSVILSVMPSGRLSVMPCDIPNVIPSVLPNVSVIPRVTCAVTHPVPCEWHFSGNVIMMERWLIDDMKVSQACFLGTMLVIRPVSCQNHVIVTPVSHPVS